MTWSIVAHDAATGAFAVAVTTRAFAVGARCPFVRSGVGAVATQASVNSMLGPMVLDLLEEGASPADAIETALAKDAGRDIRQIHAVDRLGRTAAWTGRNCVDWAGHRTANGYSVAGNMLAGAAVVDTTFDLFGATGGAPLAERLLDALDAGQVAGGDKRGKQSAGLLVTTTEDFPDINLRVDDSGEPLPELRRLLAVYRRDLEPVRHIFPTKANFAGLHDLDAIEALWRQRGLDLAFRR